MQMQHIQGCCAAERRSPQTWGTLQEAQRCSVPGAGCLTANGSTGCLPPTAHWVLNRPPPTGRLTTRRRTCRSGFDVVWPRLQVVLPVLWSVRCEHTGMSFDFTGTRAHRHMSAQAHERCLPRPDGNSRQPHTPLGRFPPAAHPSPSSQHRPSHQPTANRPCTAHLHPIA